VDRASTPLFSKSAVDDRCAPVAHAIERPGCQCRERVWHGLEGKSKHMHGVFQGSYRWPKVFLFLKKNSYFSELRPGPTKKKHDFLRRPNFFRWPEIRLTRRISPKNLENCHFDRLMRGFWEHLCGDFGLPRGSHCARPFRYGLVHIGGPYI
jgi:hypothetical protein